MPTPQTDLVPVNPRMMDNDAVVGSGLSDEDAYPTYMTTEEAAAYLRRSVSWMLGEKDIPYYRGKPNLYRRGDLDRWMDENRRYEARIA